MPHAARDWPLSARRRLAWSSTDSVAFSPRSTSRLNDAYSHGLAIAAAGVEEKPVSPGVLQILSVDENAWSSNTLRRVLCDEVIEARVQHGQHDIVLAHWDDSGRLLLTVDEAGDGHFVNQPMFMRTVHFSAPILAHAWLCTERAYTLVHSDAANELPRIRRLPWLGLRNPFGSGHAYVALTSDGKLTLSIEKATSDLVEYQCRVPLSSDGPPSLVVEYLAGDIRHWSDGKVMVALLYAVGDQLWMSLSEASLDTRRTAGTELACGLLWAQPLSQPGVSPRGSYPTAHWVRLSGYREDGSLTLLHVATSTDAGKQYSEDLTAFSGCFISSRNFANLAHAPVSLEDEPVYQQLPDTIVTSCSVDPAGMQWCLGTADGRLEVRPM
ncbi:hypothetical protein THASP1DRAFT_27179 [Thamnocephalis sphaerospora]|uniref:Uncharacterized protein n=1 Tax=Thamnocephalis sphaerospora TaxID=78915 RepID=A0A4V1IXH5_9FUNG|nr:hypothetical protein THASP1DRAFT_27179 [Thamnocephalis sphaerospora]|eukprot:RKP11079.1 hypothetical protein THASP1DRAFT_27179 [Thamnocephalis sphaerospora]